MEFRRFTSFGCRSSLMWNACLIFSTSILSFFSSLAFSSQVILYFFFLLLIFSAWLYLFLARPLSNSIRKSVSDDSSKTLYLGSLDKIALSFLSKTIFLLQINGPNGFCGFFKEPGSLKMLSLSKSFMQCGGSVPCWVFFLCVDSWIFCFCK